MATENRPTNMPISLSQPDLNNYGKEANHSSTRKRKRSCASPVITRNCSVELIDVLKQTNLAPNAMTSRPKPLHHEVAELKNRLTQVEKLIEPLLPLIPLLSDTCADLDTTTLLKASHLIDFLSTEVEHRLRCKRQVIAYNIADKIPSEKAKEAILQASGLEGKQCRAIRLRKANRNLCCPLLLEFQDELSSNTLLKHQKLLQRHRLLNGIKLSPTHTRLQRELAKSMNPAVDVQPRASSPTMVSNAPNPDTRSLPGLVHPSADLNSVSNQNQALRSTSTAIDRITSDDAFTFPPATANNNKKKKNSCTLSAPLEQAVPNTSMRDLSPRATYHF